MYEPHPRLVDVFLSGLKIGFPNHTENQAKGWEDAFYEHFRNYIKKHTVPTFQVTTTLALNHYTIVFATNVRYLCLNFLETFLGSSCCLVRKFSSPRSQRHAEISGL